MKILNLLKKFQKEKGISYLFIAHDLSIVRFISDRIAVIYKGDIVEIAEAEELFDYPLHPYTRSLISAIPIPDPKLEKNKKLFIYDPSVHHYEEDKPKMVDIGHNHFVYGNSEEIENYKKIRESGKKLKSIQILDENSTEEERKQEEFIISDDSILNKPLHDTGSNWYLVLSLFLPIVGIILAPIFKHFNYIDNYKVCKKWSIISFIIIGSIIVLFFILLLLALI